VSKLLYRVRLCIEGVPAHLRHASVLGSLFSPSAIIEEEVCELEKHEEEECARMWLWTSDPDDIAITGTLLAEEPEVLPEEHYADGGAHLVELGTRLGPAGTLDYDVIIHVDRVVDYTPLPDSPSHKSMASDTSGLPDEELEEEWPVTHRYVWRLGVPDRRPLPVRRRVSVYDRLGGRDRSPPRGGGAGGARFGGGGYFQMPPSGPHDVPDLCAFRGSSSHGGRGDRQGEGGRRAFAGSVFGRLGVSPACVPLGNVFGRLGHLGSGVRSAVATAARVQGRAWCPKQVSSERKEAEPWAEGSENSFRRGERSALGLSDVDPMEEEAARAACLDLASSARVPCSVEPTAPMADPDPARDAVTMPLQPVRELSGSLQETGVEVGIMVMGGDGIGLAACSVPVLRVEGCVRGEPCVGPGAAVCPALCEHLGSASVSVQESVAVLERYGDLEVAAHNGRHNEQEQQLTGGPDCVLVPSGLGVPLLSGGGVDVGEACVLSPSVDVVPKVLEGGGVQERGPAVCGGPVAVVGPSADVGFDLNVGLEEAQEELSGPVNVLGQMVFEANMGSDVTGLCAVLGAADGRLNKVLRESEGNMGLCRGCQSSSSHSGSLCSAIPPPR
jgi:hypothetical protein